MLQPAMLLRRRCAESPGIVADAAVHHEEGWGAQPGLLTPGVRREFAGPFLQRTTQPEALVVPARAAVSPAATPRAPALTRRAEYSSARASRVWPPLFV